GNGVALSQPDFLMMMTNLLILPRPPVFITTNRNQATPDFRYWLDLNRNTYYDPNNTVMVLTNDSGVKVTNTFTGDPEWIGILDHPDQRHSSSNFFIGRYAFIALPIGNSLDFNFMHNHAKPSGDPVDDAFRRNQGVGSWEINLAGFLNRMNPNIWGYSYDPFNDAANASSGFAFQDAASMLQYRYNGNYANLTPFSGLYGATAGGSFNGDYIDGYCYSVGSLMTNLFPITANADPVAASWSGADNPNQLFTTQDLFNSIPGLFSGHLQQAGANTNSVDRYAFYNMLSQASFASAPESYPYPYITKLNLNYANVAASSVTSSIPSTNFAA